MGADRSDGLGARLRAARERRGVSLREISDKTKISIGVLDALERDDFSRLPGGIFGRAFVRSYAVEVGLDPEETIEAFLAQAPRDAAVTAGHPRSDQLEDGEALESDRRMATTFLRLVGISLPLVGLVLYFTGRSRQPPPLHESRSRPPSAQTLPPAVRVRSAPAAKLETNVAPASQPVAAAPAPQPVTSTPPQGALSPSSTGAPSPPQQVAAAVPLAADTPAAKAAAMPAASLPPVIAEASRVADVEPASAPAGPLAVALAISKPCWVSAKVDGTRTPGRLLQPGEQQTFEVRRELVLTVGDASAVSLTLNGAAAKPLGKAGEVITARLGPANYKGYLALP